MAESDAADKAVAAAPAPASVSEPLVGERCRCCMAPGPAAKDLSSQYDFMGEKEVYADMLLESFDIRLEKIQSAGWTICEVCIGRLRDSSNFKKQVLYSERCLLQSVGQLPSSGDQKISGDSKMKMVKCESMSDDNDASFLDDDYFDLETDIKEVSVKFEPQPSTSELSNDEDIPLSKMTSTKKKVTTRSSMPMLTISPLKRSSVQKTPAKKTITLKSGVKITSTSGKLTPGKLNLQSSASMKKGMGAVSKMLATASKLGQSPGTKMVLKPGQTKLTLGSTTLKRATVPKAGTKVMVKPGAKLAAAAEKGYDDSSRIYQMIKEKDQKMKSNTVTLLQCSNMTPFRWALNTGYRCYYCDRRYHLPQELVSHSRETHATQHILRAIKCQQREVPISTDISSLRCKLCEKEFIYIDGLKEHLANEHNKRFYAGAALGVLPFTLLGDGWRCSVCDLRFSTFQTLNKHVPSHFCEYICDACGEGCLTRCMLVQHRKQHDRIVEKCSVCEKVFKDIRSLKAHVSSVHKKNAVGCEKCGEKFANFTIKKKHLVEFHKLDNLQFVCPYCEKRFLLKSRLELHVKTTHRKQKDYSCDVCAARFSHSSGVGRHMKNVHGLDNSTSERLN